MSDSDSKKPNQSKSAGVQADAALAELSSLVKSSTVLVEERLKQIEDRLSPLESERNNQSDVDSEGPQSGKTNEIGQWIMIGLISIGTGVSLWSTFHVNESLEFTSSPAAYGRTGVDVISESSVFANEVYLRFWLKNTGDRTLAILEGFPYWLFKDASINGEPVIGFELAPGDTKRFQTGCFGLDRDGRVELPYEVESISIKTGTEKSFSWQPDFGQIQALRLEHIFPELADAWAEPEFKSNSMPSDDKLFSSLFHPEDDSVKPCSARKNTEHDEPE